MLSVNALEIMVSIIEEIWGCLSIVAEPRTVDTGLMC